MAPDTHRYISPPVRFFFGNALTFSLLLDSSSTTNEKVPQQSVSAEENDPFKLLERLLRFFQILERDKKSNERV